MVIKHLFDNHKKLNTILSINNFCSYAKDLYIFRHGETDWNKEGKMQYWTDIELNETGLQQATQNAKILKIKIYNTFIQAL